MQHKRVWSAYFSPSGTTKTIVQRIASGFSAPQEELNMLAQADFPARHLAPDDLLIVGVPVFSGRMPTPCLAMLKRLTGDQTPALAVVVYGNPDYDDALLELKNILAQQGFRVMGAAAFIAQHSIFPAVGAGRPDANDLAQIDQFSQACAQALAAPPQIMSTSKAIYPIAVSPRSHSSPPHRPNARVAEYVSRYVPWAPLTVSIPKGSTRMFAYPVRRVWRPVRNKPDDSRAFCIMWLARCFRENARPARSRICLFDASPRTSRPHAFSLSHHGLST